MNGIYIHIPFCKSKCFYCDFYSVTNRNDEEGFARLLLRELDFRKSYLTDKKVDTIYFGGGTPTLPDPLQLKTILVRLHELFEVDPGSEITIEANPDDLTPERLRDYRDMGFNRISIGIQSFNDEHLKMMNRRHDAGQALDAVRMALNAGFANISIDLIYGIPTMTTGQWEQNVKMAAGLPVGHISAYHLTIEPGTRFGKLKKSGLFSEIPDEQSVEQYLLLLKLLGSGGFEQYEISNFARSGQYSRHNSKYWSGDSYLGLGPSAHSYNGNQRHWNPASLTRYSADVNELKPPKGENINAVMHRNEYVMTRLRTSKGIDTEDYINQFGQRAWLDLVQMAGSYIDEGYLSLNERSIRFNPEAWFHSDGILAGLFLIG